MQTVTLKVSYAPFVRSSDSIEKVMYNVAIALAPATVLSIYFFGWRALVLTILSVVSCIGFEWAVDKIRGREQTAALDGSAFVTGLLLALNVPSSLPYWMLIIGAFVAIVISKHLFGGLGYNIFNPALVARVFLLISFPVAMTNWPVPFGVDMETAASPLGVLKTDGVAAIQDISLWHMSFGQIGGSIGETSAIALVLGALWLLFNRYITLTIPLSFILTTFGFTGIFYLLDPLHYASPIFHVLTGGLLLGAFFMATDMVTSPIALRGQLLFGFGCGLLTAIIRLWGGYPEGVSFAILIMNALVPLIDSWDLSDKKQKAKEEAK
ncbi:electron transport complex, RnfABCDGE type, D subunit [Chloroherpeton thalassium ATCC 35110]|uniref:Ion-translocating oxidoreductase complex subunit D n=1 Tax=Chloroherpeton thalassium (strain ATCC 35110 / GB-78) TaxID=517418 RepID=B3QTB2_CHLT3|nr:RnfABCDGE type electron transport complex subunit D [Chloroherpeton thalassium]ACF14211.1 electron transport complex, RnfABCDGE type, D subunit [Chloroherpeton thalassium ATCC 35110]